MFSSCLMLFATFLEETNFEGVWGGGGQQFFWGRGGWGPVISLST